MTKQEMKTNLDTLVGETLQDAIAYLYLDIAYRKVLFRIYPYDKSKREVPERYHYKVVEIANYLYNKRGAEGQTGHSENGISRSYENADVPLKMLEDLPNFVGTVEEEETE